MSGLVFEFDGITFDIEVPLKGGVSFKISIPFSQIAGQITKHQFQVGPDVGGIEINWETDPPHSFYVMSWQELADSLEFYFGQYLDSEHAEDQAEGEKLISAMAPLIELIKRVTEHG